MTSAKPGYDMADGGASTAVGFVAIEVGGKAEQSETIDHGGTDKLEHGELLLCERVAACRPQCGFPHMS